MHFSLTNFGRVVAADVRLDGITVIAGPNGSGKSTISRALYSWFTFLRQFRREIPLERAKAVSDEVVETLKQKGVPARYALRFLGTYFRNRLPQKLLDRSFWLDAEASRAWWRERVQRSFPWLSSSGKDIFRVEEIYTVVKERVLNRLDMEDVKLKRFILERYFLEAFDGQIGTLFDEDAESQITLVNDAGIARSCSFLGGKVRDLQADAYENQQMFYIEPRHLLDEIPTYSASEQVMRGNRVRMHSNRYSVEPDQSWESVLTKTLDRRDMSLVQAERLEPIIDELNKIVSVIHGEIGMKESSLVFKDLDVPGNNDVSLRNIASGVKSIAVIIRGFRNDTIHRGDILIIDEPESNLHPEWQLSFAKFLVLLHARLDMRILLNTHSPYFLKAIQIYSDTLEQGDKCTFYNMTSADGRQYKAECLTGERIQEIFKSMSMPFARLMHGEHYERSIS